MNRNRRESLRSATTFPAQILGDNGRRVSCTVIDRSTLGVTLKVADALGLPEAFTLIVGHSSEIRDVQVTWRQHDSIGVMFA